ncbi:MULTISPECIES: signal peptidase I [unclassified Bradyrhizobium]|uniref:signal peptidase I n=1 Tax=unclassified Bradyrhizobium TaxID=2631580 RepID=UPI0028ECF1F4|nr:MULTISPECIES: signal peptidase I [unclassified Bradyrhizobium]
MSEETSARAQRSPLLSIWGAPRQTGEAIAAVTPSSWLIVLLVALGGTAAAINWLVGQGVGAEITDWRVLTGTILLGACLGILNLYVSAFILSAVTRWLGGHASAASMRAVLAFSMLPSILGLVLGLVLAGLAPAVNSAVLQVIGGAFGLWGLIIAVLMLGGTAKLGAGRSLLAYGVASLLAPAMVALVIRTFLFQPFTVPSGSNMPTLLVGDYVFATKYAYGYSRFSLPFSPPLFAGRLLARGPERGDVAVFRLPKDNRTDYVKRIVGLPGDRVQMKDGQLYLNDTPVAREKVADFVGTGACGSEEVARVKRWRETLPNGVSYETLDCVDHGFYDNTNVYTVPPGHVFAIGDNRDNSTDSRMLSAVGYIPFENLIGRIGMIFFSRDGEGASARVRFERIGAMVK